MADDFSWLREFQGEASDSGPDDLFGSQMLGVQQGFEKVVDLLHGNIWITLKLPAIMLFVHGAIGYFYMF